MQSILYQLKIIANKTTVDMHPVKTFSPFATTMMALEYGSTYIQNSVVWRLLTKQKHDATPNHYWSTPKPADVEGDSCCYSTPKELPLVLILPVLNAKLNSY